MESLNIPWELQEDILFRLPAPSLARLRFVCKQWNTLLTDKSFITIHLAHTRPPFILFAESKICSVEVNLDGPSIKVHDLPSDIPGYKPITIEYCDGLLVYATSSCHGIAVCNPSLRQIRWIKPKSNAHPAYNGIGYDNTRPDSLYKIFKSDRSSYTPLKATITELGSEATKSYEFASHNWDLFSTFYSVSLKGTFYWVAYNYVALEYFIQSFDFGGEIHTLLCLAK